jgi:hypothetical protein
MNISDLIALALASRTLLGLWFQEGGLFVNRRMYFEARGGKLGKLFTCAFCLAVHVTSWLAFFTLGLAAWLPGPLVEGLRFTLYSLAAIGLVHLLDRVWPVKERVTFNSAELIPLEDPYGRIGNTDVRVPGGLPAVPDVREGHTGPQS